LLLDGDRMNLKTWMPLVLAVILGLAAAKFASDALARSRAAVPKVESVRVVVAKAGVAPGQELTADVLALGPIAAATRPPGSFAAVADAVGRVATIPMFPGQPVMEELLAVKGAGTGIQALVPKGMRAITIEVNEQSGLAGMLMPGCRVDVVTTLAGPDRDGTLACTIVQDVLVQAVGQRLSATQAKGEKEAHEPSRSITLIASPRDAEALELASATGRTRLVLRGADDRALAETGGVSFIELRGKDDNEKDKAPRLPVLPVVEAVMPHTQPAALPQPDPFASSARPRRTVTLIRGGAKSEVTFDADVVGPDAAVTRTDDGPAH
jgi:pilus assembly protein CpaB